jgi:hypothetical protein
MAALPINNKELFISCVSLKFEELFISCFAKIWLMLICWEKNTVHSLKSIVEEQG